MYHSFIGVDISKDEFHATIQSTNKVIKFANTRDGFLEFQRHYYQILPESLVVLEATGGYEITFANYLYKNNIAVHRANTRIVKSFIRSLTKLGKSDSIDAQGLAQYAKERHDSLALYIPILDIKKEMIELTNRKNDLKRIATQEKNRLQAPDNQYCKDSNTTMIAFLQGEIDRISVRQKEIINEDKLLKAKVNLLTAEVYGVGENTAISLLSVFPEIGSLNRRQVASLAGVAPHPYESGKKIGYRMTRGGRDNIKPVLYMAALSVSRDKGTLGAFYKRLIANGKKPLVAIVAVMRKMIVIINAKVKELLKNYTELGIV